MKQLLAEPWANGVLRGLVIVVASLVALWLSSVLRNLVTRAADWAEARLDKRAPALGLTGISSISGPAISTFLDTVAGLVRIAIVAVFFYAWLLAVAYVIDDTHKYVWLILNPLRQSAVTAAEALTRFLPDLVVLVLVVALGRVLQSLIRGFTRAIRSGQVRPFGLDATVAGPTHRILSFVLWVSMIILAAPYLPGADSKAFQAVSVMLGLLVSLGSSSLVSNLIGGLTLTYSRAYRVGDRVRIGEHLGDVTALGAITTRLRTIKDEELVLPNGFVHSSVILNYSRYADEPGVQAHAEVTIGYDVPYAVVEALLVKAALSTEGIEAKPLPYVLQPALHDYYVHYEICAYTKRPRELHLIEAELRRRMQDHLFAAGIEICSPQYLAIRDGNAPALPRDRRAAPESSVDTGVALDLVEANERGFRVQPVPPSTTTRS